MNSTNTPSKLTPPVYVVKSPGLSANPKPKTPTSEYLQKPNRSVSKSSVDKENTRVTPAEKAPRTAQKSHKNTPSEEFVNSASRNRLPSTNKDKASNASKKSPFGRAETDSARDITPRKLQTPVQEANRSSARSKQGTDSRPQSAIRLPDSIKKFAQKNLLEAQSASKLGTKSVDKEIVLRHFRTEEKNTAKNEGKMSSRSENLYSRAVRDGSGSRKMSVTRPIPEDENEMDLSREEKKIVMHLRQNLEDILDDVNTSIQMTAQQMRGSSKKNTPKHIGSARKMQVEEEEEKEEQEVKLEDEMELDGVDDIKDKTERKEYSVYEDWRILDTIENLMEKGEAKSLSSRVLWANIIDPLTGLKLLDGRRSSESLRDRYKRYISCLDEAGKNLIKDFCDKNMLPELKRNHCIFKKVDGVRQLTGISSQLSYNPERISRKTPYGTKAQKRSPAAKDSKKGRKKSEGERKTQEGFEDEHQAMTLRNRVDGVLLGGNEEGNIEEMTQTETKVIRMMGGQRDLSRQVVITKDFETVVRRKPEEKPKAVGFSMTSTNVPVREVREKAAHLSRSQQHERPGFIHSDSFQDSRLSQRMGDVVRMSEQMKASKKRKADDYTNFGEVGRKDLKQIKTNNAYEEQHIPLNEVFQSRKPVSRLGNDLENFMIYVDLADGYRQFVKPDSDDEGDDEIEARLKEMAKIYKVDFALVVSAFSKVSCDYRDLEEFLQTRDERLLWTEEEDADLLNDDKVAIKYLRMMKGEERVAKRKEYLLEIVE